MSWCEGSGERVGGSGAEGAGAHFLPQGTVLCASLYTVSSPFPSAHRPARPSVRLPWITVALPTWLRDPRSQAQLNKQWTTSLSGTENSDQQHHVGRNERMRNKGFPSDPGVASTLHCRAHRFDPWSGTTPLAVEQLSPCTTVTEPTSLNY